MQEEILYKWPKLDKKKSKLNKVRDVNKVRGVNKVHDVNKVRDVQNKHLPKKLKLNKGRTLNL